MNISTGELFRDLQISYTEVILLEILEGHRYLTDEEMERVEVNSGIIQTIKTIMEDRFTEEDIESFLENGYPRATDLSNVL